MYKKTIVQLFLLLILFLISILFFRTYFLDKNSKSDVVSDNNFSDVKDSNLITNIEYLAEDKNGNKYIIRSEFSEITDDKKELILMTNVEAIINFNNLNQIRITSNNARYNRLNYNTLFYGNVLTNYDNHEISSGNMNLILNENLATIFDNVVYKNLNTKLEADKIEIDLITKNSKIFMNNNSKKVKILSLN